MRLAYPAGASRLLIALNPQSDCRGAAVPRQPGSGCPMENRRVNTPDINTFYTPGPKGYTDYPALG